jgi:peptidoglycan/LPS O-acetylase OafA/YrhL
MASPAAQHNVRRDIEGLRALAVLAVVVNHVMPARLWGGFCGVDIFFVISGYLIGMHLLEDIQAGRFSFLKFYARRARRLLPALVVVLVAVWCCGWIILTAKDFAALGRHISAATLFGNNFLLASESGYFEAPATAKPLLHLWSLGVEEQFYIVVPLLLWLGSRGKQGSIRWVVWLSVLSLLLTVTAPIPSFYLLDARFWELGVGVTIGYLKLRWSTLPAGTRPLARMAYSEIIACALVVMFGAALAYASKAQPWSHDTLLVTGGLGVVFVLAGTSTQMATAHQLARLLALAHRHERVLREATAALGGAALGLSLLALTPADWPGPQTVLPVLGTALVISAGPVTSVSRALSVRMLVFLGSISYPLYLWHWPVIVFYRMFHFASSVGTLLPILAAGLLAWCTRDLVENPARFGRFWGKRVRMPPVWVLTSGLVFTGLLGLSAVATGGYPSRYSPALRSIADAPASLPKYEPYRANLCYFHPGATATFARECTPAKRAGVPQILLWGDSHAAHLYPGLLNLQSKREFDLIQWTAAGCPPTRTHWVAEQPGCDERRAWELRQLDRLTPDTALLAARWDLYLERGVSQEQILAATAEDIQWLRKRGVRNIVLFGPGPSWNTTLASDLVSYMKLWNTETIPVRLGGVSDTVRRLDAAMQAQTLALHARYVSILRVFCNPQGCLTVGEQASPQPDLLFWDSDHLTVSGSRYLVDAVMPQILTDSLTADPAR